MAMMRGRFDMGRLAASWLVAVAIVVAAGAMARAEGGRVALVVGNGDYVHAPALGNPANDATLMARSLVEIGFDVVSVTDGSHRALLDAMGEFGRRARGAEIALFFYAGHGLEIAGRNWILPVDADIKASSDLPAAAVRVDDVLELMELSDARMRMVVLDACRNNPLPRSLTRAASRGLARIDASAAGTMIVFAAAPGEVALDGSGGNSPFSAALAAHITRPGIEVRQMMGRVRADVLAATGDKQVPWVNEAIVGDYYLAGERPGEPPPSGQDAPVAHAPAPVSGALSIELEFWNSVKDSGSKDLLGLYLKKYPDGAFRDLAEMLIASLDNARSPTRTTPAPGEPAPQADPAADLERQARGFVAQFNSVFSGPAEAALARVGDIYAGEVDFYGKRLSLARIAEDKRRLLERWPVRDYRAPEGEMAVYCNPAANSCDIRSVVYWSVSSPSRNASASGVSQTDLRIDFTAFGPRVVYENSETLSRN